MALKYWFPMTDGTLHNQGLSLDQFTSTNYSSSNDGKLGKCIKTNNNTIESGMTSTDWIGENGATLCGWFKFPESEIQSYIDNYSTTHTTMYGTLMGFNSYNGLALSWTATKPYTTFIVHSPVRNGNSLYIASYNLKSNNLMDKWVHIACIMDLPNKQISLYINGELFKTTITTDITTIPKYPFKMNMKQVYGGNGQTLSIPYYCNDIRVYDEPISPSEIKRISQGLVLHYSLSNRGFGGENLLKNTDFNGVSKKYVLQSGSEGGFQFAPVTYKRNTQYVLSCRLRGNANMNLYLISSSGNQAYNWVNRNELSDTEYRFFNIPFLSKSDRDVSNLYICTRYGTSNSSVGDWFEIEPYSLKFEEGNKPTPWTPSSSDPLYSKLELDNNIEYDLSGYQYNGTRSGVTPSSDAPRNFGSYSFNGTDSYVKCDTNAWMVQGATEFTVNWWAYDEDWTAVTNGGRMVSCTESGGFNTEGGATGYLRFPHYVFTNEAKTSRAYQYNNNGIKLADLTPGWHMFTLVYDLTGEKIYIDGTLHSSANSTSYGVSFNTNARLYLGCEASSANPSTPYFNGKMSDFRFYYTVLSADEIADLYGGGAA